MKTTRSNVTELSTYKVKDKLLKNEVVTRSRATINSIEPDIAERMIAQKQVMESNPISKFLFKMAKKCVVVWNTYLR